MKAEIIGEKWRKAISEMWRNNQRKISSIMKSLNAQR
jgi:hypothetical protein